MTEERVVAAAQAHRTNLETAPVKKMNPEARGTQRLLIQGAIDGVASIDMIRFDIRTRPQGVYHLHEHTDNVMLVLSGTLEMIVDGQRHILRENDMIFIPRGVAHSSGSGSDQPVQGIEVYAPARGTDSVPVDVPAQIGDYDGDIR
jgi:mannose-6-phosphate isomerase-like protein (cupin superfamily)